MPDIDQHTTDILGMESGEAAQVDRDIAAVREGRAPAPEERRPRTGRDAAIEHGMGLSEEMFREDQGTRDVEPREPRYEDTPQDQQREPQMVPARVIQEERERRRQLEEQVRQATESARRAEERFQLMQETIRSEQQARLAPKPEPIPNPEEDIVGFVNYMNRRVDEAEKRADERISKVEQRSTETEAQTKQRQEMEEAIKFVKRTVGQQAQQVASQHPDIYEAYNWHRDREIAAYVAAGHDRDTAEQRVDSDELNIAAHHIQRGGNSAQVLYDIARARGWNGSVSQRQQRRAPMQPSMTEPPEPRHQQTLDNVRAGMMESATIAHAAGGGSASPLSLAAYAEMDDATFARHYGGGKGNNKIDAILKRETGGRRR